VNRRKWSVTAFAKRNRDLRPGTVLRLVKLWPHARRRGYEHGEVFVVGPYCSYCGPDLLYLFTPRGKLTTTATRNWARAHFTIVAESNNRAWFKFPEPWPPRSARKREQPGR